MSTRPQETNFGYGTATDGHLNASAAALRELAVELSSASAHQPKQLHVRLALIEHGAFLSPQLFGFILHKATGETGEPVRTPAMPTLPAPHLIVDPSITSEVEPLVYVVVANHPISIQIDHVMGTLSRILERTDLVKQASQAGDVRTIDRDAEAVDQKADEGITGAIRATGWRQTARTLSERSVVAGRPFHVTFSRTLMDGVQVRKQAPILRSIYNESSYVRLAIDKLATLLSQGMTTRGGGTRVAASFARELFDLGVSRTFLAHLARDAYVCGNGYLAFGNVPDEDTRLLMPECVEIVDSSTLKEILPDRTITHKKFLHTRGAEQQDSLYGVSVLEPMISAHLNLDIGKRLTATQEAWSKNSTVPDDAREHMSGLQPFALRQIQNYREFALQLFKVSAETAVSVPRDLYFHTASRMEPASQSVAFSTDRRA